MDRTHATSGTRLARTAALMAVLGWAWMAPAPAAAQVGGLIVTITSPTSGSTVGGTINVTARVSPLGALVAGVQFQLDGANLGAEDTSAPYSVPWNTVPVSNGSHTLVAVARDSLGMRYNSDPVTVTVFNDKTPPTVAITSPAGGATVSGTITVAANATDNVGVVGVQFQLDGANLGAEDTSAPYATTWDTTTATPGLHSLRAIGRDAAGNLGTSPTVTVTVPDTTPPTASITSPAGGATVSGTITVSANASDNVGVVGVQFQLDGANLGAEDTTAPYAVTWDTGTAAAGNHSLRAVARDAAGNTGVAAAVTVTVRDTVPPTVSITSPAAGATVSGSVTVSASASDNTGVAGVQFQLDGAALGAEDTTAPYSMAWDTSGASQGTHSLGAVARDAAGNTALAAAVSVTVSNDATPPTVSITAPSSGATVQGTVSVSATATDNVAVAGVQFKLDGASLGTEVTTAPYSVSWDSTTTTSGNHVLTAVARDSGNNTATSAAVTVSVANSARKGDLFVSMMDGTVQWWSPDGTRLGSVPTISDGQVSSVNWDANKNLYVPHWWSKTPFAPGNTVTRFDPNNHFLGIFGSGYNGAPSSVTFDANGDVYVGQADDTGDILKFDPSGNLLASYDVAIGYRGSDHIELAPDGCTMFYTSRTKDIFRYDVCTRTQLPNFNVQPLPGEYAFHLRLLPDGGLVVADGYIYRLDAAGNQTVGFWAPDDLPNNFGGVDLVGDGTFWATNDISGKVHRFDLNSGSIVPIATVSTGVPRGYACGVGVHP